MVIALKCLKIYIMYILKIYLLLREQKVPWSIPDRCASEEQQKLSIFYLRSTGSSHTSPKKQINVELQYLRYRSKLNNINLFYELRNITKPPLNVLKYHIIELHKSKFISPCPFCHQNKQQKIFHLPPSLASKPHRQGCQMSLHRKPFEDLFRKSHAQSVQRLFDNNS